MLRAADCVSVGNDIADSPGSNPAIGADASIMSFNAGCRCVKQGCLRTRWFEANTDKVHGEVVREFPDRFACEGVLGYRVIAAAKPTEYTGAIDVLRYIDRIGHHATV